MTRLRPTHLGWILIAGIPIVFLSIFFVLPVGHLVGLGLFTNGRWTGSGFTELLEASRTGRVIANTLTQAFVGTVGSLILGLPGAYVLYCCRWPGRTLVRAIVVIPFVLPSVVVGIAFSSVFGEGTILGALAGQRLPIWLALIFFNYALVVRIVGGFWVRLDPRQGEAAATLGASPFRVWWTITLPALAPALASAAGMVFLFCAGAYGVVQVLGGPSYGTIETEIWLQTTRFLNLPMAAALSILQLVLVAVALVASGRMQARGERALKVRRDAATEHPLRLTDTPAMVVTAMVVLGLLITPMAALVARSLRQPDGSWGLQHYANLATTGQGALSVTVWEATHNSLHASVQATLLAVVLALCVSLVVSRRPRSRHAQRLVRGLDAAFMLPLGVSAVTLGFGFLVALNTPPLDLRSSPVLIPVAQSLVALPVVMRVILPVLRAIDPRQMEVAATLGAGPWRRLATIEFPHVLRSLGIAVGFAFAISLGEFGATSFLSRPDHPTLPVALFRLIGRPGATAQGMAMASAVVLAVLTAVVMGLAERFRPQEATSW